MSDTKKILDKIEKSKTELKNIIEASEVRLLLKIEEGNKRITYLEEENRELKAKLEQIERQSKVNNIVIFGLNKPLPEISVEFLCSEIKKLLKVNLLPSDINNFYPLGKTSGVPLKLELVSYLTKKDILKNTKLLKETGIYIAEDLTVKQRQEIKVLKTYLKEAKESQSYTKCYIRGNKLILNNTKYSLEELTELRKTKDESQVNSAPNTPNTAKLPGVASKISLENQNIDKTTPHKLEEERDRKGSRSRLRSDK